MKRDIWGVFHDGVIKLIDGSVPGTLRLEVEIPYLRGMFPEPGHRFIVSLSRCSKLRFTEYDELPTENPHEIQQREPEILYVLSEQPLVLDCAAGKLEVEYDEMTVRLESGQSVSYESLASASAKYWNDWSSRAKSDA
jgi:hypothetical protein